MRIAVTGVGVNSALGVGWDENLAALRAGRTGIGPVRFLPTLHRDLPVGEVPLSNDEILRRLSGDGGTPSCPRTALLGRLALDEAIASASFAEADIAATALISGTTVGGMDVTERNVRTLVEQGRHLAVLSDHDCGRATEAMADMASAGAPSGYPFAAVTTLSTACSSASNALLLGARLLRSGRWNRVVAGGAESLSLFHLNGFNALMILDHRRCRPFSDDRAGLNLGEGAAYLVLEPAEVALRRGARIYGYLDGFANACDAFHQTATSADGEGAYLAMSQAIRSAGLTPADIDYVNAHGTGTPNNDATEQVAIQRVFGVGSEPPFASTKDLTGHTTSASGSIEAAFCLMALADGFLPGVDGTPSHRPLRHVLSNAFGFGGNDTSLLFSAAGTPSPAQPQPVQFRPVVYVTAASVMAAPDIARASDKAVPADTLDYRQYMTPGEARRLGKMLKRALATAKIALADAGLERPDAIVTGTALGNIDATSTLMQTLADVGEQTFSPTHFMQSTHNTLASLVAIATQTHGYNATYAHRALSFPSALLNALGLVSGGLAGSVLAGAHDALPGHEVAAQFVLSATPNPASPLSARLVDVRLLYRPTEAVLAEAVAEMRRQYPAAYLCRHDLEAADASLSAFHLFQAVHTLPDGQAILLIHSCDDGREVSLILLSK